MVPHNLYQLNTFHSLVSVDSFNISLLSPLTFSLSDKIFMDNLPRLLLYPLYTVHKVKQKTNHTMEFKKK